jgi:hypothetical protein
LLDGHTTLAEFERVFGVIDQRFAERRRSV